LFQEVHFSLKKIDYELEFIKERIAFVTNYPCIFYNLHLPIYFHLEKYIITYKRIGINHYYPYPLHQLPLSVTPATLIRYTSYPYPLHQLPLSVTPATLNAFFSQGRQAKKTAKLKHKDKKDKRD